MWPSRMVPATLKLMGAPGISFISHLVTHPIVVVKLDTLGKKLCQKSKCSTGVKILSKAKNASKTYHAQKTHF
jgi:hypothetical protein